MNRKDLAREFAAQKKPKGKASALYYVGLVAYSYGPHFPAAVIRGTRAFVNSDRYSSTTSQHMSTLRAALREAGFTLTPRDTSEMRALESAMRAGCIETNEFGQFRFTYPA